MCYRVLQRVALFNNKIELHISACICIANSCYTKMDEIIAEFVLLCQICSLVISPTCLAKSNVEDPVAMTLTLGS